MIGKFRFWCQRVLPLVYDDSLSYYEQLCKLVEYLNHTNDDIKVLAKDFEDLKNYVDNFIENSDISQEIDDYIQSKIDDGSFADIIGPQITADLQAQIDKLNRTMSNFPYAGKDAIFFGDSWTAGTGLENKANAFPQLMSSKLKMVCKNYGVGGSGFLRKAGGTGETFHDTLERVHGLYPDTSNVGLIVFCGGFNDVNWGYSADDIYQNCFTYISKLQRYFPGVPVLWAGMNMKCWNVTLNFRKAMKYIENSCLQSGLSIIHRAVGWQWALIGNAGYFTADLVHPNIVGHQIISTMFLSALMGGSTEYSLVASYAAEPVFAEGWTASGEYYVERNGDTVHIHFPTVGTPANYTLTQIKCLYTIPEALRPQDVVTTPVFSGAGYPIVLCAYADGSFYLRQLAGNDGGSVLINNAQTLRIADMYYPIYAGHK